MTKSGLRCWKQMRSGGIRNYSTYIHGLTLFAYLERADTVPHQPNPVR